MACNLVFITDKEDEKKIWEAQHLLEECNVEVSETGQVDLPENKSVNEWILEDNINELFEEEE